MSDENALAKWAQLQGKNRRIAHEPLCAFLKNDDESSDDTMPRMCIGCLLVELRGDATYDDNAEIRSLALQALSDIADSARAHLDDVLEWQQRESDA